MKTLPFFARLGLLLPALALVAACTTISGYDQTAYSQVVSAKVDALALMDKATSPYSQNQKNVEAVTLEMDKAYEYEKGRTLNQITVKQWEILRNRDGDLFGGFLKRWQEKGTLNSFFVDEKKKQVGDGFDQIIQLEAQKIR